ncbi:MAG TPA: DNA-processing protein DprA, partial [Gammaproteobacteria bacterium]
MRQDPGAWLKLQYTPGISLALLHKLLGHFGDPVSVCHAKAAELAQLGLTQNSIEHLHSDRVPAAVDTALNWAQQPQQRIITLADDAYPPLLRSIHHPPPVLYVKGNYELLSEPQLAIVGSRNPSRGGQETARAFSQHLAQTGLIITSGLALGIDGAAHRGALDAKAPTIAVMATGIDRIYPARHRTLAQAILEKGAIISELPLGTEALPALFPQRNRII